MPLQDQPDVLGGGACDGVHAPCDGARGRGQEDAGGVRAEVLEGLVGDGEGLEEDDAEDAVNEQRGEEVAGDDLPLSSETRKTSRRLASLSGEGRGLEACAVTNTFSLD